MKSVRARITGRVQGVGFRAFVERAAAQLGVRGWVRNRRDGSVEAVIAGVAIALGIYLVFHLALGLTLARGPLGF